MNQAQINKLREGVPADLHEFIGDADSGELEIVGLSDGEDPLTKFFADLPLGESSQQSSPDLTEEMLGDNFSQSHFLDSSPLEPQAHASDGLDEALFGDQPQAEFIKAANLPTPTQVPTGGTAPTRSGQTPGTPRPVTPPPTRKASAAKDELVRLVTKLKDDNPESWKLAISDIESKPALSLGDKFIFAVDSGDIEFIQDEADALADKLRSDIKNLN
jgi:hypothetical protein